MVGTKSRPKLADLLHDATKNMSDAQLRMMRQELAARLPEVINQAAEAARTRAAGINDREGDQDERANER